MDELLQLAHWAECKPDEPALLAPGRMTLTYGALLPLLRQARSAFRDAGVRPREAVAVLLQPGLDSILACMAVSGGSAFVPLDPSLTNDEYGRYLKRLGVSTLVVQDGGESPALAAARELGLRVLRARLLSDGACNNAPDQLAVETVLPRTSRGTERRTDAVLLLLTSSTTGDPKLVPVSAANLTARCTSNGRALGVGPADRCLAMMPFFHMHGIETLLTQLLYGGSVVCTPGFDPLRFACWWKEFHPTWFSAGVPLLHAIAASSPADGGIFASAPPRFIFVTGASPEPALREAVEQIMHAPLLVGYGLTESGPATRNRLGAAKAGSVGTSSGLEIAVADPLGNILPPHHEGEVLLRGPAVIPQYLDDEEANRQGFRNGWFRTGDLGRFDDDGFLFLSGRL
jgi:acyl-CoA synthetase (AMP-forming)/AMP-acid ligase II